MKYSKSDFVTHLAVFTTGIGRHFNKFGWEFNHGIMTPLNPNYITHSDRRTLHLEINRDDFFNKVHPVDKRHKLISWGVWTEKYDLYCLEYIIDKLRCFLDSANNKHFINYYADDTTLNHFIVENSDDVTTIKIMFLAHNVLGIPQTTYYIEQYDSEVIGGRINTHVNIYDREIGKAIKCYTFPKIV